MTRLAIIFGGRSVEHGISLNSAVSVLNAIDKSKYEIILIGITREGRWLLYDGPEDMIPTGEWQNYAELKLLSDPGKYDIRILSSNRTLKDLADVVFPVLHGPGGEDGSIQGLLEVVGIPYVGCKVLGSALAMDKAVTKAKLRQAGIPVCDWFPYLKEELEDGLDQAVLDMENMFGYPLFVKPSSSSASIGVTKVKDRQQLREALQAACQVGKKVLVERFVDCREIEVGIIGNTVPLASAVGEIIFPGEFLDNETKIKRRDETKRIVPAQIPPELAERAKQLAIDSYITMNLSGYARVDFFIDKETDDLYVNEINTIPAFSADSMFARMWAAVGLEYTELLDRLIGAAFD